jgi:hypothetical protein
MPEPERKAKREWAFFMGPDGHKAYNKLCCRCIHDCKQSYRAWHLFWYVTPYRLVNSYDIPKV